MQNCNYKGAKVFGRFVRFYFCGENTLTVSERVSLNFAPLNFVDGFSSIAVKDG